MSVYRIEQQIPEGAADLAKARAMEVDLTLSRRGKIAVTAGAVLALLGLLTVTPPGQQMRRRAHLLLLLRELRGAAADAGVVIPYLTERSSVRAGTLRGERPPEARRAAMRAAADGLIAAVDGDDTAEAHYAAGIALLIKGDRREAIASFQSAARLAPKDAAVWAALAEAQRRDALAGGRASDLCHALASAHRSLLLDADLSAARHAWAAALDDLGVAALARTAWRELLAADPASAWRPDVEAHLAAPLPRLESEVWMASAYKAADAAKLDEERLRALVRAHPEIARGWVESQYLTEWARAFTAHDAEAAAAALAVSRRVAGEVRAIAGETLAGEAVAAIDEATRSGDSDRLAILARGQIEYQDGRILLNEREMLAGGQALEAAATDLRRGGSPLAAVASHYAATAVIALDQAADAAVIYRRNLDSEAGYEGHRALRAMSLREFGLSLGFLGRWNESLAALRASESLFERLGESTNLALVCLDLAAALDQLGLAEEAWRQRIAAFRLFSETGQDAWIETTLADATLFAIASRDWEAARAFAALDIAALGRNQTAFATSRAWMRRAFIEVNSGENARESLDQARAAAHAIADPKDAERTLAEIEVVEALSIQQSDPRSAAALLSRSIDFYTVNGLNIFLPDVHLLRARAFAAAGDDVAAWRDVTMGIAVLEEQRSQIAAGDARSGIFDRSAELFDDAVRLALRQGNAAAAFEYAERSRARALLDMLGTGAPRAPESIAAIQSALGDGVLVEFHALPEKLVTFVISRQGVQTFESAVTSVELVRRVAAFVDRTVAGAPAAELERSGGELFELLLAQSTGHSDAPLVIAADGVLRNLPFASLYDRLRGQYVIQGRPLVLTPSAAVFADRSRAIVEHGGGAPRSALVIGDPAFDGERFPTLARLDGSDREARAIAPLYAASTVWRGDEATKKRFVSQATGFELLHFGGHAVSNHANPAASFLLLAASADGDALYSSEIARMDFSSTRIVVLAACGSLQGQAAGREGLATIGRSFLEAGVPTVVGTLWPIDDDVSAKPLTDLHRQLARGVPADEAVRSIQLAMLTSADPMQRHPSRWAAFAVLGAARR
ncbi:MAG TPA: CHAT domain-containing protein [Thermoanaerobaculia bacterium]|nr:CHAT domain-containing protein [Thermoanaerobaculia bacterium]